MSKGKEFIVSWDDLDDDDLFDEDIEPSQGQSAPAKDDATPTAAAVAPARIFRKPESANSTPTNEPNVSKQDLRNENKQLSTSSSNINTPGRFHSVSGTSEGSDHHIDSSWKGESDWRSNRMRTSKPIQPVQEDLRDAIRTMTRQMKNLESPGIRATKSIRTPQSRSLESGITLVAIRTSSDPKPSSSSGRPSASDVIAAPPKWDSYRPRSRSGSRSRGKESRSRKKSRSRSRGRSWSRSRRRSWSRSRGRARSRSRDRSWDRETSSRHRSRSRERSRSRGRRRSRERSRSGDGYKSIGRSRDDDKDKSKDRDRDKDKERNRDRDKDKDKVMDRGRGRDRDVDKWRTSSRSRSTDKSKPRGRSRSRSALPTKAEEKSSSRTNSVSREAISTIISTSPSSHITAQTSNITTMPTTTSTTSSSLSASLSARRSPADQLIAPSTSLPNIVRNNSTTLAQTTTLSNMEASIDSLDLTRPTLRNTTTITSSTSSPVTEPLQTTDPDLATDLQGFTTSTNIKVESEDPPTLAQAAKASSPEVAVKQEPLSSDDATKSLPQASQPTIPNAPGLVNPMEAEVGAQDPHYIVIRVSDEGDFNDARRSNVWNTNPMYNKALRELYSPTSQVFLIFTVFMSSEFCGIAKMASEMMWEGERTIFDKSNLRQKFKLQWVACSRVSYDSVKEFTHEPIYKIIRKNGCELPQDIGGGIHKLLVENQPEEEPQPTLALQEDDSSALDITATSFSQDMLMGEGGDAQESPILHLNSLFMDTSDMDVDLPEPTTIDFQDKDKDEDQDQDKDDVDSDETSSSMDLDSNPDIAADLIESPSPKATLLHSPQTRKRSISADGNDDLSMERALADEEQRQLIRDRSMEPTIERTNRKADDEEEKEGENKAMEKGETISRRDVSPIREKSPRKLNSPPPSIPSRRWSPSRRRSPPPPQMRSSRRRSPPPPTSSSRYWLPPPPTSSSRYWPPPPPSLRRNRSPPPPRRRPPRRGSPPPPPSHYSQSPPYERSGLSASTSSSYGFRSPPPFPQRSKDPRDRSASTYVFHSGSGPNYQRDRFSNAPTDPRLLVSRNASSSVVPQKRPYDEQSGSMEDDKGTVLANAVDLPASVFPLEDDADDGMDGHFVSPTQPINPSATGASSSSSSSAAPGGPSSSTSTTPSTDPPIQITSITLIPSGMSKSRRKKMRKEALAKPLDF